MGLKGTNLKTMGKTTDYELLITKKLKGWKNQIWVYEVITQNINT